MAFFVMPFVASSQTVVDFESLVVPESGYFNGSTEHSGTIGSTERFDFTENGANFRVYYTLEEGWDYWSGTAYSSQTDLTTADWTNYSAYSSDGGGYDGSNNYAFGYINIADTIFLDEVSNFEEVYVANSVWAYHYMNGSDGAGTGTYEAGDYLKIIFKGLAADSSYTGAEVGFFLADFTNGNDYIIDEWTVVDLSSLTNCLGFEILMESSDSYTPLYYCLDNLTFSSLVITNEIITSNFSVYPNPTSNFITIDKVFDFAEIYDITGKRILKSSNSKIDVSDLDNGIYTIKIIGNNVLSTKFIKE